MSDHPQPNHSEVFNAHYGDMLIALHEEQRGARAWRDTQGKRSESIEYSIGRLAGDIGHLASRISIIESNTLEALKETTLWRVGADLKFTKIDMRLRDLETAVDSRASETDLEVLQARLSERARADTERHPITAAKIGAVACVVAALISAAVLLPTSCQHRTERVGTTQIDPQP